MGLQSDTISFQLSEDENRMRKGCHRIWPKDDQWMAMGWSMIPKDVQKCPKNVHQCPGNVLGCLKMVDLGGLMSSDRMESRMDADCFCWLLCLVALCGVLGSMSLK